MDKTIRNLVTFLVEEVTERMPNASWEQIQDYLNRFYAPRDGEWFFGLVDGVWSLHPKHPEKWAGKQVVVERVCWSGRLRVIDVIQATALPPEHQPIKDGQVREFPPVEVMFLE